MDPYQIVIQPVITEKSSKGNTEGKYTFLVNKRATKIDIKRALKQMYKVDISDVNIITVKKKTRLSKRGREITKRSQLKKATITTKGRKNIDINKFPKEK